MDLRHKKIVNLQEQQKQLKNKLLGTDSNGLTLRQRKIKKYQEDSYNKKMKSVKVRKVKRKHIQTNAKAKKRKNTKTIKFDSFY